MGATRVNNYTVVPQGDWAENRWIAFLLKPLQAKWLKGAESMPPPPEPTIHIVMTNDSGEPPSLTVARAQQQAGIPTGLIHLADEWGRTPTDFYRGFHGVWRNYTFRFLHHPSLRNLPLGPGLRWEGSPSLKWSERPQQWFWTGTIRPDRAAMLAAFSHLPGGWHPTKRLSDAEYEEAHFSARFIPCPMGSATPETWRLYEVLEAGAIPLVESRWSGSYFRRLFGADCPLPEFRSWRAATRWVRAIDGTPEAASLQAKIADWWEAKKTMLQQEMSTFFRTEFAQSTPSLADWRAPYRGTLHTLRWWLELSTLGNPDMLKSRLKHKVFRQP